MWLRAFLVLVLLVISACSGAPNEDGVRPDGVLAKFADADGVELLALHPYPYQLDRDGDEMERFHGYGVLGRADLVGKATANELVDLIERGIEGSNGMVAACFNPRHGLRVTVDGSDWDFLICYECLSMKVYRDGDGQGGHLTVQSVEPKVTAVFAAAGLQIHRDDHD